MPRANWTRRLFPGLLIPVLAIWMLAVTGCGTEGSTSGDEVGSVEQGLVRCGDCDDVLDWVRLVTTEQVFRIMEQNYQQTVDSWSNWDDGGWWGDDDWMGADDDEAPSDGDNAGDDDATADDDNATADDDGSADDDGGQEGDDDGDDFSDTNTQEENVDEADIVKTDGSYLYLLAGGQLLIFDPTPAEDLHELARVDVLGKTHEMFLYENYVVVFSRTHPQEIADDVFQGVPREELLYDILVVTIFDISDTSNPTEIRRMYIEGGYLSSRRIGGQVRIVVSSYPPGPQVETWVDPWPYENNGELDAEALRAAYDSLMQSNRVIIESAPLEAWLPRYYDVQGSERHMGFLSNCDDFFHPLDPMGRAVSTLVTIDLGLPGQKQPDVALLSNGTLIYGSTSAIYIAGDAETAFEWTGESTTRSMIHKFDISGEFAQAQYTGSGEIEGWVLNQFSMGESKDGDLRVASTSGWWGDDLSNHVYVLRQGEGRLDVIGHLGGIAPGETIMSARFMGDRGYLVTFVQTDPLFTLDVSDPTDPRIVGELHIPGFSTYIHPFDNDHILTIGQNGDEWGSTGGVVLQLFDISNFADPQLAYKQVVAEGWDGDSEALRDHKAFLYYEPKDLLAIPLIEYGWDDWTDDDWSDDDWGGEEVPPDGGEAIAEDEDGPRSGVMVYRVTPEAGFTLLGFVDHTAYLPEEGGDTLWSLPVAHRSVVIGDYLYTISDAAIVASLITGVEEVAHDELPYENPWDDYWDDPWTDDGWSDGGWEG